MNNCVVAHRAELQTVFDLLHFLQSLLDHLLKIGLTLLNKDLIRHKINEKALLIGMTTGS